MLFWYLLLNLFYSPPQPEPKPVVFQSFSFLVSLTIRKGLFQTSIQWIEFEVQTAEPVVLQRVRANVRSRGLVIALLVTVSFTSNPPAAHELRLSL